MLRYINCSLERSANFLACPFGEGAERSEAEGGVYTRRSNTLFFLLPSFFS